MLSDVPLADFCYTKRDTKLCSRCSESRIIAWFEKRVMEPHQPPHRIRCKSKGYMLMLVALLSFPVCLHFPCRHCVGFPCCSASAAIELIGEIWVGAQKVSRNLINSRGSTTLPASSKFAVMLGAHFKARCVTGPSKLY